MHGKAELTVETQVRSIRCHLQAIASEQRAVCFAPGVDDHDRCPPKLLEFLHLRGAEMAERVFDGLMKRDVRTELAGAGKPIEPVDEKGAPRRLKQRLHERTVRFWIMLVDEHIQTNHQIGLEIPRARQLEEIAVDKLPVGADVTIAADNVRRHVDPRVGAVEREVSRGFDIPAADVENGARLQLRDQILQQALFPLEKLAA